MDVKQAYVEACKADTRARAEHAEAARSFSAGEISYEELGAAYQAMVDMDVATSRAYDALAESMLLPKG